LAALVVCGATNACAEERLPPKEKFHLYLLVGQSNMAGRGKVEEEDRTPIPRVLVLTKDNTWAPAVDPLHFDKPSAGVGLGRSFAKVLAEADPQATIGLVPCAAGGSPIDAWQVGGFHTQTNSHPYDDMLVRMKAALKDGTLKAILWHQGESDSSPGKAEKYQQKLHELIARMRKDLDAEDAPFLAGQMGLFEDRPWDDAKKLVDAAHRNLPRTLPQTAFVSAEGLAHKGDGVHFDSASYREFGRRYAKALLEMSKD
jgi:hypothetical protein